MVAQSTILTSVAARLRRDSDNYSGMATVISPQFAITTSHVIPDLSPKYTLELDGPSGPFTVQAEVLRQDDRFDLVLLRLLSPVDKWLAPPSDVRPDFNYFQSFSDWQSFYKGPGAPEGKFLHGTIGEHVPTDARDYLSLIPATRFDSVRGFSGAPVLSEERLIGIMAASTAGADVFYAVPITEMIKSSLWTLISEVTGQTTPTSREFDEITFFKHLSEPARTALERANGIRVALASNERIHMEHLLAGLFKDPNGTPREAFQKVGIDELKLTTIIKETASKDIPLDREYETQALTQLPLISKHVEQAFVAANDAARNDEIKTGHLLFGVLSLDDCDLAKALRSFGLKKEDIPLVDTADEITKPPTKRRYANAGISSDGLDGPDLLDIEQEVQALCTVLAAKDVQPPISLGLFGDWGSGKSFFMRKMEKRFDELKALAKREDSDYCANIVQLWFNAWHYMDTDLWASVANKIFNGLAEYLGKEQALLNGKTEPDYERAQLIAQNTSANDALAKARQAKQKLDEQITANHQQLASIRSGEADLAAGPLVALRETYQFAVEHPEVSDAVTNAKEQLKKQIDSAAKKLNIDADQETVQKQILELHGLWGYVRAIGLAFRDKRNRPLLLRSLALGILILVAILLIPLFFQLDNVQVAVSKIAAVVLAIAGLVGPFLPRVRGALQIIDGAIKANFNALEKARSAQEVKLQQEQERLAKEAKDAQGDLDAAVALAKNIQDQLKSLQPDQQILDFVKQRQQSTDYTRYFGVIARARDDFEQLSSLLAKERERRATIPNTKGMESSTETSITENGADPKLLLPRIDRIILYIDDLDRCPENKVVDVLQAVHLLLAFPLFIVVVGVDSRWLLHSLRQHSEVFRNQDDGLSQEERTHWQSTPLNYLEKIFQVPFTLWPMEKSGFGKMIDSLTTSKAPTNKNRTQAQASENQTPEKSESKEVGMAAGVGAQPTTVGQTLQPAGGGGESVNKATTSDYTQSAKPSSDIEEKPAETPPKVIDPHPAHLQLTKWEVEFMKELHCLIPSPRATKRFVNVYRLIRASVDIDDELQLKEFVGDKYQGQYRAVLILLAIVTGYPDQATDILRELIAKKPEGNWLDFIESFRQREPEPEVALKVEHVPARTSRKQGARAATNQTQGSSTPDLTGNGGPHHNGESYRVMTAAEADRWEDLIEKSGQLGPLIQSESCAHFIRWAPKVARYSFQSGRVLLMHKAAVEPSWRKIEKPRHADEGD